MICQSLYRFALAFRPHDLQREISINRLGTTTKIFIVIDYLIRMSEKYFILDKDKSMWQGNFLPPRKSNWAHIFWKCFSNYVYLKNTNEKLKEIWITEFVSKSTIFLNLWISKLYRSLHWNKIWNNQTLRSAFLVRSLVQNILLILSFIVFEKHC